jgi:hypothetical protein
LLMEVLQQARFANPRLAHDQHRLDFAFKRPRPTNGVSPRAAETASSRPRTPLGCITWQSWIDEKDSWCGPKL